MFGVCVSVEGVGIIKCFFLNNTYMSNRQTERRLVGG